MLKCSFSSSRFLLARHNSPRIVVSVMSFSSGTVGTDGSGCPFSGEEPPLTKTTKLYQVPILPFAGSLIPQYSGAAPFDPSKFYDVYRENRRRFGEFYKIGFPGFGKGRDGELYILTDPNEMMKVLRQERGSHPYPRGVIEAEWPLIKYFKGRGSPIGLGGDREMDSDGFMGRGETWKRLRTFLQKDMLSPDAASSYIPGMVEAAEFASKGAPASSKDLNAYTNRCAFDMFCSFFLGELTRMADPNTGHSRENIEFCNSSVRAFETLMGQLTNPFQLLLFRLGIQSSMYNEMVETLSISTSISRKKYKEFRKRYEAGELNEQEQNSYMARAIERQAAEGSTISEPELAEIIDLSLTAAVETTSSLLSWNMVNLSLNPDVQEKLYAEIADNVKTVGGRITGATIGKQSPYLHAVLRETQRLTPPIPATIMKENSLSDVNIHGSVIPKDSLFVLDAYSVGMDPEFVEHPGEFRPERWLPEAVKARQGTPSEILDHPYYKSAFSQGSRKCPGSRVASNEILIMLSQLVLDWKMSMPSEVKSVEDVGYKLSGFIQPIMPEMKFDSRINMRE
jgi:cytochrome P450